LVTAPLRTVDFYSVTIVIHYPPQKIKV
jgi:hypothetical protein